MKPVSFLVLLMGLLLARGSLAAVCQNTNGSPATVDYDLTTTLTAAQNQAGTTTQLSKNQDVNVQAVCPSGSFGFGADVSFVCRFFIDSGNQRRLEIYAAGWRLS